MEVKKSVGSPGMRIENSSSCAMNLLQTVGGVTGRSCRADGWPRAAAESKPAIAKRPIRMNVNDLKVDAVRGKGNTGNQPFFFFSAAAFFAKDLPQRSSVGWIGLKIFARILCCCSFQ